MLQGSPYSKFLNQILVFKGVYNLIVGNLQTHYEKQVLTLNISSTTPHSFWKDKPYISVEVMDNSGRKTFERVVQGLTNVSFDTIPMQEGFVIKIFHAEAPARLLSLDGITNLGVNRTTHTFLVTRYGLMNLALGNNPLFVFLQKLYQNAGVLQGSFSGGDNAQHLLIGARSLPQPHRTDFVMKHNAMMSECSIMFVIRSTSDNDRQGSLMGTTKQGLHNLIGTVVDIKVSDEVISEEAIQPQENLFSYVLIPYGVYSVEFRGRAAEQYIIHPQYVEVKDSINPVLFDFIKIDDSLLVNDISLDDQLMYINARANDIAMSAFRSSASLYISNEKKLLLAAIRSLPGDSSDIYLNKYGGLFGTSNQNGGRRYSRRYPSRKLIVTQ